MSHLQYNYDDFSLWFNMEVLKQEFPDVPLYELLYEASKLN
jgi:hypothetical protein